MYLVRALIRTWRTWSFGGVLEVVVLSSEAWSALPVRVLLEARVVLALVGVP